MKKILGFITALFLLSTAMQAMPYEEACDRARYLTDKMAYELNLNDQQYNDVYEINLDYLMNIRTAGDVSGFYLEYRNADLRHILYDWQYSLFQAATYFFRPIVWRTSGWYLPVYGIYRPGFYYYNPPRVYGVYRGGHFHHRPHEYRASFYANRRPAWHGGFRGESRGPVAGRPAPHRENHGFRIESPGKHNERPRNNVHRGNGFRLETPSRPQNNNRPGNGQKPATEQHPSNRPQSGNKNTQRERNDSRPQRVQRQKNVTSTPSNYHRKSSTRTTVNRPAPSRQRSSAPVRSNRGNNPRGASR